MHRVALLSYHSCPTAKLGERDAGGMNVYVRYLAQELARLGTEVDIFSRRHDPLEPAVIQLAPGVRLVHIEAGPTYEPKEGLYEYLLPFYCNLQEFVARDGIQYDLVHSHYWLSGRVGEALARNWGVPHVVTFHTLAEIKRLVQGDGVDPPLRSATERRIAASADAIVVSDQHEVEALVRLYGARRQRIQVTPCGVDVNLFRPMDRQWARGALGLNGQRVLLFVGRLDPLKGVDVLLRIVAAIQEQQPRVLIVGGDLQGDAEGQRLMALARDLGLGDRVRFEGVVPHQELPPYYNAADALVMPSYYESFGLVALEAMACGTPVVASRVGGLASLVKDWDTGCLVAGHCPDSFAQRLEVLLSHPDLQHSMGQAARRYAQEYRWDTVAQEFLALYRKLSRVPCVAAAGRE
jgi:D-inositol-3-phosphate glycosyltransferase